MLGNVNERLKENAEVLHKTQQGLGERLDNAARVVGSVQKSLGGLEEANRRIYEIRRVVGFAPRKFYERPSCAAGWANFFYRTCSRRFSRRSTSPRNIAFAAAKRSTR